MILLTTWPQPLPPPTIPGSDDPKGGWPAGQGLFFLGWGGAVRDEVLKRPEENTLQP